MPNTGLSLFLRINIGRVIDLTLQNGDFVKISYTGSIAGMVFDTTDEEKAKEAGIHNPSSTYGPITVGIGKRHVILGLDDEMEGKEPGYETDLSVPPEKAFGEHDPKKVEAFQKNQFKEKLVKGMSIKVPEKGEGTVIDIIGGRVLIDFNHPFAGKTLDYTLRIEERVESAEEIVRGLIQLYIGRQMDLEIADGKLTITLPPGITFDRRWVLWRSRVIHETFESLTDVQEIVLLESFKRPDKND